MRIGYTRCSPIGGSSKESTWKEQGHDCCGSWENRGGDYDLSNPINSFIDVVRRLVFRPVSFFAGLPRRGNFINPLVFALICYEISAILGGLLGLAGGEPDRGLGPS